jgi:hypothetical protein
MAQVQSALGVRFFRHPQAVSLRISKKKSPGAIFRASPEGVRRRDAPNKSARARHRFGANPQPSNRARNQPKALNESAD